MSIRVSVAITALLLISPLAALAQDATQVTPQGSPPDSEPPPPPDNPPAPPQTDSSQTPDTQDTGNGQWVFTSQYGWIWMPYDDADVYTPSDESGDPYAYAYEPTVGWAWLVAPWIWGVGPLPYFGARGPWHFHWYRGPAYNSRSAARPLYHSGHGTHAVHTGSVSHGGSGSHSEGGGGSHGGGHH